MKLPLALSTRSWRTGGGRPGTVRASCTISVSRRLPVVLAPGGRAVSTRRIRRAGEVTGCHAAGHEDERTGAVEWIRVLGAHAPHPVIYVAPTSPSLSPCQLVMGEAARQGLSGSEQAPHGRLPRITAQFLE